MFVPPPMEKLTSPKYPGSNFFIKPKFMSLINLDKATIAHAILGKISNTFNTSELFQRKIINRNNKRYYLRCKVPNSGSIFSFSVR